MPQQHLIEALQRRGIPATEERPANQWRHSRYYLAASIHGMSEAIRLARRDGIDVKEDEDD